LATISIPASKSYLRKDAGALKEPEGYLVNAPTRTVRCLFLFVSRAISKGLFSGAFHYISKMQ